MNCVLYLRVSSIAQDTQRQRDDLINYANKMGYNIIDEYSDKISGFNDDRPGYLKLKAESESNKFDIILISEMSRMTRKNQLISEVEFFKSKNKQIYFLAQNIHIKPDVNDLGTSILLSVLSAISSYEVSLFKERVASGRLAKCILVNASLGEAGRGYKSINGVLNVDESMVDQINMLFELYAGGMTASQVVKHVNDNQLINWKLSTKGLFDIIRNPQYKGMYIRTISGERIERYEPSLRIVSDELWDRANLMRSVNKTTISTKRHTYNILLDNKLECVCGQRMVIKYPNKTTEYMCNHRSIHHYKAGRDKCELSRISKTQRTDAIVWHMAGKHVVVSAIGGYNTTTMSDNKTRMNDIMSEVSSIDNELQSIDNQFNKYIKNAIKYNLSSQVMDEEHARISAEKKSLKNRLNKLNDELIRCKNLIEYLSGSDILTMESFNELYDKANNNYNVRKELVNKHIDKVISIAIKKANVYIIRLMDSTEYVIFVPIGIKSNKYYHASRECYWLNNELIAHNGDLIDPDMMYDEVSGADELMNGINMNPYLIIFE